MVYIVFFIGGVLFSYVFQILDMSMSYLSNKQILRTSKIQAEVDSLSHSNNIEQTPAIGFKCQSDDEEYYADEE